MDDVYGFPELSTMLTALDPGFHIRTENRIFNDATLTEYAWRIRGTVPVKFPALVDAYKALGDVQPKPPGNHAHLPRATVRHSVKSDLPQRALVALSAEIALLRFAS